MAAEVAAAGDGGGAVATWRQHGSSTVLAAAAAWRWRWQLDGSVAGREAAA